MNDDLWVTADMKPSIGSVLYLEDDEDTRELITLLLRQSDYEVVAAKNYDEALLLARTTKFDLYIIDNWMAGRSGIDLCKALRELSPWTPVLFYSGAAYESDKQQALAAGAQAYLIKPTDPDELIAEVSRLVSGKPRQSESCSRL